MKLVTKSGTEYKISSYEEVYDETSVHRTVTFDNSVDLASAIEAMTTDELSDARIEHVTVTVDLPPLAVESGYRYISSDSAPSSSVSFKEI